MSAVVVQANMFWRYLHMFMNGTGLWDAKEWLLVLGRIHTLHTLETLEREA